VAFAAYRLVFLIFIYKLLTILVQYSYRDMLGPGAAVTCFWYNLIGVLGQVDVVLLVV